MKNYILDTNVLLHDPDSIFNFEDNRVIILPITIREINDHKRSEGDLGRNSRKVSRAIRKLIDEGRISDGVRIGKNGILQIPRPQNRSKQKDSKRAGRIGAHFDGPDKVIIEEALRIHQERKEESTILVTKDMNMAIMAGVFGLPVQDYRADHVKPTEVGGETFETNVEPDLFDRFITDCRLEFEGEKLRVNQYGVLSCNYPEKSKPSKVLVRVDQSRSCLVPIVEISREGVFGIRPRNTQQTFLFDALFRTDVHLVMITGKAGTGKTLITMAAALEEVNRGIFDQIVVARPTVSMGKEIGFLPGSLDEKLAPWMVPIDDAIGMLEGGSKTRKTSVKRNKVVFQSLSHIRGRSMRRTFLVIDESQNLTPLEVKTIITRAGAGTKIVLTGDPKQIDVPYVDEFSNGLVYTAKKFSDQAIAAHVELLRCERSTLADLATDLL